MRKRITFIFNSSRAAVDLASIMVGIIVIGLIGAVIAATVFAVIPWTQNNAAKQQLDSVVTAENAYSGLHDGKFSANLDTLLDASNAGVFTFSDENTCFGAFKTSPTGNTYYVTSKSSNPVAIPAGTWSDTKPNNYPANCTWPSVRPVTGNLLAAGTNDAGFEKGGSNWQGYYNPTATSDTTVKHSGASSVRLDSTGPNDGVVVWQTIQAKAGSYGAGMWLKAPAGTTWIISLRTDPYSEGQGYKVYTATGDWQHLETVGQIDSDVNAVAVQVHSINTPGNYTAWLDDADLFYSGK